MLIREAHVGDIPQLQLVRHSVKENKLTNPALVTDKACEEYITIRGKGWVCETKRQVVGFAIADLIGKNIWALFLHPEFERQGIGRKLHDTMLDWYFTQTHETVSLGTEPGTRAESFYHRGGWKPTGISENKEVLFEMTYERWINLKGTTLQKP